MLNGFKLALVGEFTPWKLANLASQGFILPREPVVQHGLFLVCAQQQQGWAVLHMWVLQPGKPQFPDHQDEPAVFPTQSRHL